jgi:hypothetical protein
MVEEHFRDVSLLYKSESFDCELLKNPNITYTTNVFNKVKAIKEEYDKVTKVSIMKGKQLTDYEEGSTVHNRTILYKEKCLEVCGNEEMLCNIVVDLCYNTNKSKQFAWQMCGDIMVANLLRHRNYTLSFPLQTEDGDFTYKGLTFKMEVVELEIDSE